MSSRNACGSLIKQIHDELEQQANNALRPQGLTMAQVGCCWRWWTPRRASDP